MNISKKTYVDIEEITYRNTICYSVIFTEYKNINIFRTTLKILPKIIKVPFLFKTLDIAKDFCELHPVFEQIYIANNNYDRHVYFSTYKLKINNNIFYIKWDNNSFYMQDEHHISFEYINKPLVDKFVSSIELQDWLKTFGKHNIKYFDEEDKLSSLINCNNKQKRKWHFELVEQ